MGWRHVGTHVIDRVNSIAVPFPISIAVDQNGTSFVLYGYKSEQSDKYEVKMAVKEELGWNVQNVPSLSAVSGFGNVALDSKGQPHFILSRITNSSVYPVVSSLMYYSWAGQSWNTQEVASNVSLPSSGFSSNSLDIGELAFDFNDFPHITYVNSIHDSNTGEDINNLLYTVWTGNNWKTETIKTNTPPYSQSFLFLDSNGNPHITYTGPITYAYYFQVSSAPLIYVTINRPPTPLTSSTTANTQDQTTWLALAAGAAVLGTITTLLIIQKFSKKKW
jgi:hypothetical protein